MKDWDEQCLLAAAAEARSKAYAPYSRFAVGAALLTNSGKIFPGANVENASFGLTICAERVAAVQAIMAGELSWRALAVVTAGPQPVTPCGACRQFLAEFAPELEILLGVVDGGAGQHTNLRALLPAAFALTEDR
ncbi:MAG TPA: cytidine deaminase [Firmicutes bacterium]|jgi:cytidine deaminase|nr:cytidine deaminase [Bacillota bacterium]